MIMILIIEKNIKSIFTYKLTKNEFIKVKNPQIFILENGHNIRNI